MNWVRQQGFIMQKDAFHNTENCHCDRGVLSYNGIQEKREKINELHIYRRMQGWHAIHGVDE